MRTRKPCPGCGEVVQRRAADKVCHQCEALMADGRRFREERQKEAEPLAFCRIPQGYNFIEVGDQDAFADWKNRPRQRLADAFASLVELLTVPVPTGRELPAHNWSLECQTPWIINPKRILDGYRRWSFRMCQPEVIPALTALDEAIRDSLVATAKKAKADGSSAVLALARGEITLDEFNDEATGKHIRVTGEGR